MYTEWNREEEERARGRKEIELLSRGSERSEIPRDPKTHRLEEVERSGAGISDAPPPTVKVTSTVYGSCWAERYTEICRSPM